MNMKVKGPRDKSIWLFFNIMLLIVCTVISAWYAYKTATGVLDLINNKDFVQKQSGTDGLVSAVLQKEEGNLIVFVVCLVLSQIFWWISILKTSMLLGETKMISQVYPNTRRIKWLTKLNRVFLFFIVTWPISLILDLCAIIYLSKLNKQLQINGNKKN